MTITRSLMKWSIAVALTLGLIVPFVAQAQQKPNILVIFGDDIGQTNISAYGVGILG